MLPLYPLPATYQTCPYCSKALDVTGWLIPGMRTLAELRCPQCEREFYGDLPAGHGLFYPMLLEKATGTVHNHASGPWFAERLHDSYQNRSAIELGFEAETFREIRRPLLLNCLDAFYGHALLKLLNAQYYLDQQPEFDLIVLVPHYLRWMVPRGVAAIWDVDLPLSRGAEWNDWLADEIKRRVEAWPESMLSVAFSHPHPEDFEIERFTRVAPFPVAVWQTPAEMPSVTFIWRDDRLWTRFLWPDWIQRGQKKVISPRRLAASSRRKQQAQIHALAERLRGILGSLEFAVVGFGESGGFPPWIQDLRTRQVDATTEQDWCHHYARSHVVIGVHGSNMLLPSAHAGAVVEIVPDNRWGNLVQDLIINKADAREALFRYRFLQMNSSLAVIAQTVVDIIKHMPAVTRNFGRSWNDHSEVQKNVREDDEDPPG